MRCILTVSTYGIRENSTIAIIGGDQKPPSGSASSSKRQNGSARPTEQSTIDKIRAELTTIHENLVPSLDTFLTTISAPSSAPARNGNVSAGAGGEAELAQEHARIGELLLQALLRLDVIPLESEWQDARKERKVTVREVQGLLDKLDGGWKARGTGVKS